MIQQLLQLQRPKKAVGVLFCFCVLLVSATFPISWLLKKKQPQQQQQQQQANNGAERTRINPNSSNNSSSRNSRSNSWTVLHRNKNTKNTINNTINNSTIHQLMESTSHRNVTIQNQIYSSPKQTKMNKKTPHQGHHPRYINPIRQITILGERNSGTRWTFDHLSQCFSHGLKVTKKLTRYKHWFQFEDPSQYEHDTLVIAQFRNPYDWLKAMQHVPHHSPQHLRTMKNANLHSHNSENDWRIILTREWTMERMGQDLLLLKQHQQQQQQQNNKTRLDQGDNDDYKDNNNNNNIESTIPCQENFVYRDLVSCVREPMPHSYYNYTIRYSEHQPFYEMRNDGSGQPYANILQLRTDKIRNFLSIRSYSHIADVWIVQYEYLLKMGTNHLLQRIQEWTGVIPKCIPESSQIRTFRKSRFIEPEFAKHVRLHLNWTVESWIGYNIQQVREDPPREW